MCGKSAVRCVLLVGIFDLLGCCGGGNLEGFVVVGRCALVSIEELDAAMEVTAYLTWLRIAGLVAETDYGGDQEMRLKAKKALSKACSPQVRGDTF